MKHLIVGSGEALGIASHIAHAKTVDNNPIILVGSDEVESGINTELPQIVQNLLKEASIRTNYDFSEIMSGREKRRERRKQNRKK